MISTADEQASFCSCKSYQLQVFFSGVKKHASAKTLQMERVTIPAFSYFLDMFICSMRKSVQKSALVCAITHISSRLMHLIKTLFLWQKEIIPFSLVKPV